MINKDGGGQFLDFVGEDTAVMKGYIELMAGPPIKENPVYCIAEFIHHSLNP